MNKITIDLRSRTPIFEQLRHNIRELALNGTLEANEQLPSVRALACELAINPNTIQKAYAELERDGIIYSLPARGSFVSADLSAASDAAKKELRTAISDTVRRAKQFGMDRREFIEMIHSEWGDDK